MDVLQGRPQGLKIKIDEPVASPSAETPAIDAAAAPSAVAQTLQPAVTWSGAPGPIKPGASETVVVHPVRSFFYSTRSPDNLTRYPFAIHINVYY